MANWSFESMYSSMVETGREVSHSTGLDGVALSDHELYVEDDETLLVRGSQVPLPTVVCSTYTALPCAQHPVSTDRQWSAAHASCAYNVGCDDSASTGGSTALPRDSFPYDTRVEPEPLSALTEWLRRPGYSYVLEVGARTAWHRLLHTH